MFGFGKEISIMISEFRDDKHSDGANPRKDENICLMVTSSHSIGSGLQAESGGE